MLQAERSLDRAAAVARTAGRYSPANDLFLHRYAKQHATTPQEVTRDALFTLTHYYFPSSVRELEHIIERAAVHATGGAITGEQIQKELATAQTRQKR